MQDENHVELELKLRRSGRVDFMADLKLTNTARLHRVLDSLGLLEPSTLDERLHAAEVKLEALAEAFAAPDVKDSPSEPEPQPDDEALVELIAKAAYEAPSPDGTIVEWSRIDPGIRHWRIPEARGVLDALRAEGLLRTPDEALDKDMAYQLQLARAQVRALTAKAEEAHQQIVRLKSQLAHAEKLLAVAARDADDAVVTQAAYDRQCAEVQKLRGELVKYEQTMKRGDGLGLMDAVDGARRG